MGKASRLKKERRLGLRERILDNPITRKAIQVTSRKDVVAELSKGTVSDQTSKLNTLVGEGVLPAGKLKAEIMRNAPKQMDKAIKDFKKQGKEISIEGLLVEVRNEPGFLKMCESIGLDYAWFQQLAKERMEVQ